MTAPVPSPNPAPNPERRNPETHRSILEATVALLEADGYRKLSIEGIAARAGVGKQTIYRWWRGKAELVLEAYIDVSAARAPEPDTGAVREDLERILKPVFVLNTDFSLGTAKANKGLMAEAQLDPEFLTPYRSLISAWHGPLERVLERGKARGELKPETNSAALIDLLLGAAWYRLLLEHAPLNEDFMHTLLDTVLEGSRSR